MNLTFDRKIADGYKSQSQKIRVLTEKWVENSIFCPSCGDVKISKYENNNPVGDFYCLNQRSATNFFSLSSSPLRGTARLQKSSLPRYSKIYG